MNLMIQNNLSPKSLFVLQKLILLIVCFFALPALSSCSSINPMTQSVAIDVQEELITGVRGFRFYVSTDISFERLDRDININPRETIIQEQTRRTIITLSRNTPGRLYSVSTHGALNVAFENGARTGTLSFVQNRGTGAHDRYYLNWVIDWQTGNWLIDPVTGRRVIIYDDEAYLVDYRGNEEPYLRYRRTARESTITRRMRGVR